MIEITKTKYWCSSCGAKENIFMITIRLGDNNGTSFVLCKSCLNDLNILVEKIIIGDKNE